jgi:prepilin-type N-terminal cleavage/methylation domain-containing protein
VKRGKQGFTLVELLTVLGIIAILVGLLVPALAAVRNIAMKTKQQAQLVAIDQALISFRSDYGDYPPSYLSEDDDYCGAQKLAEALVGWDLLGFHPDSHWQADGRNNETYWARGISYAPDEYFFYDTDSDFDMDKRKGPYLERETANAFRLGNISEEKPGLFDVDDIDTLAPDTYVLCDKFSRTSVTVGGKIVKAGTPILYYKANTSSKVIRILGRPKNRIYNYFDNSDLAVLNDGGDSKLADEEFFYEEYIIDPKIEARPWPYRPDSYILISAGADGEYGTSDDITNFGD